MKLKKEGEKVKQEIRGKEIVIEGKLGKRRIKMEGKDVEIRGGKIYVYSKTSYKRMIGEIEKSYRGVEKGYRMELEIKGLGYRMIKVKGEMYLKMGYSHYIEYRIPKSVRVIGTRNKIIIMGINEEEVRGIGKEITKLRKEDRYKGKGIVEKGKEKRLKEGKDKT